MKRPEFKSHILIVDTNILWYDDKRPSVDPAFDTFWNAHSSEFPLELMVPEIVFDELKFQQNTSARKAMEKATQNLANVSNVTDSTYQHRVSESKISTKIDQKFEKWRKKNCAVIIPTPYAKIDWRKIVDNSIWRRPPFEFGERKDRSEKGFRDSMILETVVEFTQNSSDQKSISFVCEDSLLRKTADKCLENIEHFSVFESLDEFEAYLRLLQKDLTNEFIRSILRKVTNRFFKPGSESALYNKFDIMRKMSSKGDLYSKTPTLANPPKGLLGMSNSENWIQENHGQYWISPPVFQSIENQNVYLWQTKIEFSQPFKVASSGLADIFTASFGPKLLLLEFRINWSIKIGTKARLWEPKLIAVELVEKLFTYPTDDQKIAYDLENIC